MHVSHLEILSPIISDCQRISAVILHTPAASKLHRLRIRLTPDNSFLSAQVPTFAYEKRLSRIETLRLAITYIAFMVELLSGPQEGGEQHLGCRALPAPCYPCPAGVPFSQLRSI